ncbi:MAG: SHOCT domain-containing protein [Methylomicrobium sp.]|nr:SHOCT domain-containing protein [Methylomicrobium sp.]
MTELLFFLITIYVAYVVFLTLGGISGFPHVGAISKKRKAMKIYLLEVPDFSVTQKVIGADGTTGLAIDEQQKKVCLIDHRQQNISCRVVSYESLLSSELFEDGSTVTKTVRSSQIGGALIGGVALGGVGAIIGGLSGKTNTSGKVKRIDLRLIVNDTQNPLHDVNFLNFEMNQDSPNYQSAMKTARHWHGLIEVLIKRADMEDRENPATISQTQPISIADELKKLADLRDLGILSVEEFQQQKAKLLGSLAI